VALVAKYDTGRSSKAAPTYEPGADEGLVNICSCPTEAAEAEHISKVIWKKLAVGEARDCFVLVPNRNYVGPIVGALSQRGVPHEVGAATEGTTEWTVLKIVRGWVSSPSDPLLTRHLVELIILAGTTSMPGEKVRLDAKVQLRHSLNHEIADLWVQVLGGARTLVDALETAARTSNYLAEVWTLVKSLRDSYEANDASIFVGSLGQALGLLRGVDKLYTFLADLEATPGRGTASDVAVRVLTYRNGKGLEADCVFVVGLEGTSIPRDVSDSVSTAEEARLIFVAMTRARKELHLHHARRRTGAATYKPMAGGLARSVFLDCLPRAQRNEQYIQSKTARKAAPAPRSKGSGSS
jgi:hypothetical protein